jgi:serine/threonine protein kinase
MVVRFQPIGPDDPSEVGGYQLRARLGAGGMGSVYLSFTRGGLPVAVKVMRREFADDPEFRRRFIKEVAAAQRVQGRYTAQVLDADPGAPVPWLAAAYIPGPSLQNAVAEYGPLPLFSVFRLLAGTAEGIANVHAAGLIHRDLKPANVLLAVDGPRVIDFGIVHAADASTLTGTGQVIGTPAFMAPEQISGRRVTEATDAWAFGHLAIYAATGHAAFGEGIQSVLIHRIVYDEPRLEDCPEPVREFARRCLAKSPADRPTIDAILHYASSALRGQTMRLVGESWLPKSITEHLQDYDSRSIPVLTKPLPLIPPYPQPTTPAPRSRQLRPGRKPAVALTGATVLLAAALLIVRPWQAPSPQAPSPSTNPSAPSFSGLKPTSGSQATNPTASPTASIASAATAASAASPSSALSSPPVVAEYLSDASPLPDDIPDTTPQQMGGIYYLRSVSTDSGGCERDSQDTFSYVINREFHSFKAVIGLNDQSLDNIPVGMEIDGDGRTLYSGVFTSGKVVNVVLNVTGVRELDLKQTYLGPDPNICSSNVTIVWGNAELLP